MSFLSMPEYWRAIRDVQRTLDDPTLIVSLGDRNGRGGNVTMHATAENAAKCIVDGTHRVATAEEIEQHNTAERTQQMEAGIRAYGDRGIGLLSVTKKKK